MDELSKTLLTVVISATVFFELVGPVLTRMALRHSGEVGRDTAEG